MREPGKCDVCGADVPQGSESVTVNGWYSGHQFVWSDRGLVLLRVRCEQHPFDADAEYAQQAREEDEGARAAMEEESRRWREEGA